MSTSEAPAPDRTAALSLRRDEAEARRALLEVTGYDVDLDLTGADSPDVTTFTTRTTIGFDSGAGDTFVDLEPVALASIHLDGAALDPQRLEGARFPLHLDAGRHELVVESRMRFRHDGEGLHRSVDPADGRAYLYGMSFMEAARSIFACFDQPDLKAPYTLHVTAPQDWEVVANGVARPVGTDGAGAGATRRWDVSTTQPLSTYFVTLVAGPYHLLRSEHDGISLGLSSRASLAGALDADAEELFTLTGQCFDELHRLFGIRYPFGDYHQAFVPEFNAGAMENPGCVTFRDQMLFDTRVTRASRISRATTVAHEMAHQWFGNLVTPRWWDDLWLNESFAEYLGNRVVASATQYDDAWAHHSFARRQWGLNADQRPSTHPVAGNGASDASSALQDFDGISYAKGSAVLKQLVSRVGDEVFLGGVVEHMERHRFGNATMADLVGSWERAGAGDLGAFTDAWLSHAGLDTLTVDREAGGVRREPPVVGDPVPEREHATTIAVARGTGDDLVWERSPVRVVDDVTSLEGVDLAEHAVVLDPDEETWAASCVDETTLAALPGLAGAAATEADPSLRSALWNNVRSAFHLGRLDPAAVVEVVVAAPPLDDLGDVGSRALPWTVGTLLPLADIGSTRRVHEAVVARLAQAPAASDDQLRALRGAIHTAQDAEVLRGWLAGTPSGLALDQDLRWRLLVRLAVLGETDRDELDGALADAPSTMAGLEHTRAVASLPDPAAKQWAWERFTGATDVPNHEVEAAGAGFWQHSQLDLTEEFVRRYAQDLPGTASVRSGWTLASSAASFFPRTHVDEQTVAIAREVIDDADLGAAVRRRVVDATDDLSRRLAVARAYPQDLG